MFVWTVYLMIRGSAMQTMDSALAKTQDCLVQMSLFGNKPPMRMHHSDLSMDKLADICCGCQFQTMLCSLNPHTGWVIKENSHAISPPWCDVWMINPVISYNYIYIVIDTHYCPLYVERSGCRGMRVWFFCRQGRGVQRHSLCSYIGALTPLQAGDLKLQEKCCF